MPLAVMGLGLAQLGTALSGAGLAVAAPAPSPTAEAADDGGSGKGDAGKGNGGKSEGASKKSDDGESRDATPCAATVKACVRLSTQEVWITDGAGKVLRGPIRMNHGDRANPTPTGTFHVQRKDQYHVSQEQGGRKMPYAVFFDGEGRAFHQGDPERQSVGCIRMGEDDARWVFEHLDVGDSVQIVR